jgi:two-component system response regulator NreC
MRLIAWGHTNVEIAEQLHLSVRTVETYKARIMEKLHFNSRTDIVRYALRRGWLRIA